MNVLFSTSEMRHPIASAKRGPNERKGLHGWHPYYAGYSEKFVESGIQYLGLRPGNIVLDPWAGSGTTGIVANRLGLDCVCLDINPVMATFAAGKSKEILKKRKKIHEWLNGLPNSGRSHSSSAEPLEGIFEASTAAHFRDVIRSIPFPNALATSDLISDRDEAELHSAHSFCLAVLFVALRELSGTQKLQNPTWLRTGSLQVACTAEKLLETIRARGMTMLDELQTYYSTARDGGALRAICSDVKTAPLPSDSVDAVITSPPYLTRIDYAVSTSPEMLIFGNDELLQSVRHRTMGAPVITKNDRAQHPGWGELCNSVLDAVRSHPTKAAASYYWKNIVQYFMDMDDALKEIMRVLKPGGSALIVVQSSYFKDVEIPLGEIYAQAANNMGFSANIASRDEIRTHMAHVNTRSSVYKTNKVYFEDVVHLVKQSTDN